MLMRVRRLAVVLAGVGLVVLGLPAGVLAAGDVNRAQCGAETEASPGFRSYLPDCRAYELVTPPYKNSAVVLEPAAIFADGTHVIAWAGGAFAGAGNDWWQGNKNPNIDAYEFTRTEAGWKSAALTPPATEYPHSTMMAASADALGTTLWGAATTSGALVNEGIYLRNSGGEFLPVGPGVAPEVKGEELESTQELSFAGASRNLTRSLFSIETFHQGHSNLWPGDTTEPYAYSLYEYVYAGAPDPEPTLVGVSNEAPLRSDAEAQLISRCGTELGSGKVGDSAYNAVSEDGETVFFTARACGGSPAVNELYARIGAARTVAVSEPSREDCEVCNTAELANATFQGASQNGEKVFFLTEQKLLAGQEGMNLYEYDFNGPAAGAEHPAGKVALVSGGSAAPEVQGVVRISEDGSRVYFVAKGMLGGSNAEGHEPEQGAENLYVYNTVTGDRAFVAKLLTSAEEASIEAAESTEGSRIEEQALAGYFAQADAVESEREHGEISGAREEELLAEALEAYYAFINTTLGTLGPSGTLVEDRSVWQLEDRRPAQATPDGRFLVFPSSADLTAGDESKLVPQLFEYDASEEKLTRVSIGQGGTYNGDGNVATFHDAPQIPVQQFTVGSDLPTAAESRLALSSDGSSVFFTSAAGLAAQAVRGDTSVYEYREGGVYLISDGQDASLYERSPTVQLFGIDPSGGDALFLTADPLVPQDGETQMVLYDAREEGGFPAPVLAPGCVGETCRGPSGASPQLSLPGSASQAGGGNLAPPATKPARRPASKSLAQARKLAEALKACAKKPKKQRAACVRQARKRNGGKAKVSNTNRGGK
jgi:hypothetical protein